MDDTEQEVSTAPATSAARRWCVQCGAEAETSWGYCGSCGGRLDRGHPVQDTDCAPVLGQDPTDNAAAGTVVLAEPLARPVPALAHGPATPRRRRRSPLAITTYSLVAVLVLGLAGLAGYEYQQTSNELDATHAELVATKQQLDTTSATLVETEESLEESQSELSETTDQLQDTEARLRTARRELSGLEGSLENAQDRLDLQANQIETLKICLEGVTNAMGYAAYSDYGAAIASLEAVEVSCQRAYELF